MLELQISVKFMERFTISSLARRQWIVILVLIALVTGLAYWFDKGKDPVYYGAFTISVQVQRNYPQTDQLILQPSAEGDLRTALATTQSWVQDPYYVQKALENAGVEVGERSLKELSSTFLVVIPVDFSSSYQVQYVGSTADEVRNVSQALQAVLEEAEAMQSSGEVQSELTLDMSFTDTTVTSKGSGLPLVPIAGLLAGTVFGFVVAAILDKSKRS